VWWGVEYVPRYGPKNGILAVRYSLGHAPRAQSAFRRRRSALILVLLIVLHDVASRGWTASRETAAMTLGVNYCFYGDR
jgi:hypothetical protein